MPLRVNLLIMIFVWSANSVGFFVTNFYLKYLNGSIFFNTNVASLSQSVVTIFAGFLFYFFGLRWSIGICYITATVGATCIMLL